MLQRLNGHCVSCSDPAVKETQGVNLLSRNGNSQTGERMTQKRPRDGWILDPHGPARVTNGTELSVAAAHTDHFVVSLQHTSCAASVHYVNGIHDYVMKATINSVAASVVALTIIK